LSTNRANYGGSIQYDISGTEFVKELGNTGNATALP
jgi:hypothetical protein